MTNLLNHAPAHLHRLDESLRAAGVPAQQPPRLREALAQKGTNVRGHGRRGHGLPFFFLQEQELPDEELVALEMEDFFCWVSY